MDEKRFLHVMAQLGVGPHKTADIAESLGIKIASISPPLQSHQKRNDL